MTDERTQTLADGFVLGSLERSEAEEFSRRLAAGEPSATRALQEAQRVAAGLPYALAPQMPPEALKQSVMRKLPEAVHESSPPAFAETGASIRALPQRQAMPARRRTLALAASLLLAALGAGYILKQRSDIQALALERRALAQQVQEQQRKLNELEVTLAFHISFAKAMQKPRVMLVDLSAPQGNHEGRGKVVFDRDERRAYFISLALPVLPEDQDYQLWHIGKSGPVDGGVFRVDSSGYAAVQVLHLSQTSGEVAAFAVTREPKGGSAKPTLTQMYLLGKA